MAMNFRLWMGLGGVPPGDRARAYLWERRLHWPMVAVTLLTLPAFYLGELTDEPALHALGRMFDLALLLAFSSELAWMLTLTRQRRRYLAYNWLAPAIVLATALSLLLPQSPSELSALLRLLRLTIAGALAAQAMRKLRTLTPGSTPAILLLGFGLMLLSGGGLYWLEPTVHSYGDGVWLAFTSGLTVGYGDLTPTTPAARLFAAIVIVLTYGVMSLVTASIAAFFIGKEEKRIRTEMHQDLKALRQEIALLRERLDARDDAPRRPG